MRVVFMGTPAFAVPSLSVLLEEGANVAAVVTQPDRPQGRKREPVPPPVKAFARERGLTVLQPEKLRRPEAVAELAALKPDLIVTAAYGQILPRAVLDLPPRGCVNVHGSLLPRYRGGAPIQRAIMNGETVTGVTLMYMAETLDTGDMIASVEVPIKETDTAGDLFEKLGKAGAELLRRWLPALMDGTAPRTPQDERLATYAPNLTREDERIDWARTAREVHNQVRALAPMVGAYALWRGQPFKVWACFPPREEDTRLSGDWGKLPPGAVLEAGRSGIRVRTGDGSIVLAMVQPAGKKAMPAAEFARGARLSPGDMLE
jgi:methionyl-tRNA formyltransferase